MAGLINGTIILVNIPKNDVPSIFAASITEFGTLIKYCLRKKIIVILPNNGGIMSGNKVSTHPQLENIENCGIMILGYGIIIAESNNKNNTFLNGNLNFANANAAKLDVNDPIIHTVNETIKLFLIPESNGPASQISLYFDQLIVSGIQTGGKANTSAFSFTEVDNIHNNGAIIIIAPANRTRKIIRFATFVLPFCDICCANVLTSQELSLLINQVRTMIYHSF